MSHGAGPGPVVVQSPSLRRGRGGARASVTGSGLLQRLIAYLRRSADVLSMLVALPLVVVIRALRPLILIRVGALQTGRIGPLAACPEIYLCEREARIQGTRRSWDIFYPEGVALGAGGRAEGGPCNSRLLRMWQRVLLVHPFVRQLARANRVVPGGATHAIQIHEERDFYGVLAERPTHLRFSAAERAEIDDGLRRLGLPPGARFVPFHARDRAYLKTVYGAAGSWDYHNYRNSDIESYLPAAREMTRRGSFAVRVGSVVEHPLETNDPKIIDYSCSGARSELMDLALGARCWFFLGNDSGLLHVPVVFRRRVALANYIPLNTPPFFTVDDLFIPKRLWSRTERRLLTFREMMDLPWVSAGYRGLEVINSTPQEILDLAVEMDERLTGAWRSTDEDEDLQRRFRGLYHGRPSMGPNLARIGAKFLRENRELLD